MHKFANPARFMRLAKKIIPWSFALGLGAMLIGLYGGLFISPEDEEMAAAGQIIYVHVPVAYMAQAGYIAIAIASLMSVVWKHPLADLAARACAPVGMVFTVVALFTGALWGRPMWGTYWEWDGRMTSVLFLLFLYLGYMAVWSAIEDRVRAAKIASIVAMVGVINVFVIKFSVEWWNTLHQPASIITTNGFKITMDILWPLLLLIVAFKLFFITIVLWRIQSLILQKKASKLEDKISAMQAKGYKQKDLNNG
jgi:heme exporter protein C